MVGPSEKTLGWHVPGRKHLTQASQTIGGWVVPQPRLAFYIGIGLTFAGLAALIRYRRLVLQQPSVPTACLVFGLAYAVFVLLARVVVDQNIPLDARMLAPLQVLLVVGLCATLRPAVSRRRGDAWLLLALAILTFGRGAVAAARFSDLPVAGYTSDRWRSSETLAYAASVASSTLLVTNTPDPVWLWHRRTPLLIPPRSNLYNGEENRRYVEQVGQLREATACRDAIVVFFDRPTRKPRRYIDPTVVRELDLTLLDRLSDGEVYDIDDSGEACG